MLYTAVNYKNGPIALRYPRGASIGVPLKDGFDLIEIGKAETLRQGSDVALLALGSMVQYSLAAAEKLEQEGISCKVINMRFAKPLDTDLLDKLVTIHHKIVTLEENALPGGFGSAVSEYFSDNNYKIDLLRIGLPDEFIEHGTQKELHHLLEIDPEGICCRVKKFVNSDNLNPQNLGNTEVIFK
jgi:1-deoxy-D-xylulose-5-phosphate synthase